MTCQAKGCEADASATVTTPFGSYDLCSPHTDELVPPEARFESTSDPSLYIAGSPREHWPDWL